MSAEQRNSEKYEKGWDDQMWEDFLCVFEFVYYVWKVKLCHTAI